MGDLAVDPYFQKIVVKAFVETSESQERIDEMREAVDLRCPVFKTIKDAFIPIENE